MPTLEEIRRLNPAALAIYKQQVYRQARSGDPYMSRLLQAPEYQSIMGAPERPWWQHPLDWMRGVEKGAGAILTAPFTPNVKGTENLPWFEREKAEYEAWEEPSFETQPLFRLPWTSEEIRAKPWTIGVKGLVEQVPWFATALASGGLGAMGWAGRTAGIKGLQVAAQVGAKALKPIQAAEAFPTKMAIKGVKTAIKPIVSRVAEVMPDLQDINQAIKIASRPDNLRELANVKAFQGISRVIGGRSATMKTAEEQAVVGRQILLGEGETKTVATMARLKRLGNQESVFGKIGNDGRFVSGEAKGILQNELFTYPDKYLSKLNPAQRQWIEIAGEIEKAKLAFLKRNRIKVNELKFEEGGIYAGQRVAGRFNKEGILEDVAYISPGARTPGAKAAFLKTRIFTDPEEAAKLGYRYLARDEALALNTQAAYNTVANKQMTNWVLERIPYRTAGATELTRARRLAQVARGLSKGKVQSTERLRLVSKEYPDLAKRLKGAVQGKVTPGVEMSASRVGEVLQAQMMRERDFVKGMVDGLESVSKGDVGYDEFRRFLTMLKTQWAEEKKWVSSRPELKGLEVRAGDPSGAEGFWWEELGSNIDEMITGLLSKEKLDVTDIIRYRAFLQNADTLIETAGLVRRGEMSFRGAIPKAAVGRTELDNLRAEAEAIYQKAQLEWSALSRTEQISQRAYARAPRLGEAMVRAPAFQGKILTGEDATKVAELLNKEFSPGYSEALGAINKVNAVGRFFALSGDMSPFGIQLIFMPWTHPKAYGESIKGFLKALGDKEFLANYIARNADVINDSPSLLISAFEPTEAMARTGILGRIPGVKNVLEPLTRGYDAAMTVAGIEMKKALRGLATTPERIADIDAFINEVRGVISTSRLGISATQRQGEAALLLAPKYNRAIVALLSDAFRSGIRGSLARDALLKTTIGISASAVAISYAIGEDEKDILEHLDPRSSRFLTWQIAGQNVGPGSKVRSILKLIGASTKNPEDIFRLSMENPGLRFIRGNFAPVLSTGLDLLTGRNYVGDPTRDGMMTLSKTVIGENLVPIWLQSVIWEGGTLEERGVRGAAEFFGGRAYPMMPYQELEEARNNLAQQTYGMDWNSVKQNMGELYQLKLERDNPELKRLKEVAQKESSKLATGESAIWDKWNQLGLSVEERYRSAVTLASREYEQTWDGTTFREKIADASLIKREMYDQRQRLPDFESIVQSFNEPMTEQQIKSTHPLDLARKEYYKVMYSPDMYDQYGNYNFELAEERENQFIKMFGQGALDYIQSFGGMKWEEPIALKRLREAKEILEPYWEIETQIWSQYPPELQQIAKQIDILDRTDPNQSDRMLFQYPQIVYIRKQIAFYKKRLKIQRPDIAQALRTFYTY